MFFANEVIRFSLEKVDFTLSDFKHQTIIKPYALHYHSKDSFEIHYIKKGSGIALINNTSYQIEAGYFYFTGPYVIHGQIPNPNETLEKYSMYFTVDSSKGTKEIKEIINKPFYVGKNNYNIESFLENIENEFVNKKFGYKEMVIQSMKMVILSLSRNFIITDSNTKNQDITNYLYEIEQVFMKEFHTITLSELAKRLYMSERELQRFLSKNYNKNFNTLKLEARMFYASNQLLYTDNSILEISEAAGYSSCEHFSYAFKKYYNISPLKFRKNKSIDLGDPVFLNLKIK